MNGLSIGEGKLKNENVFDTLQKRGFVQQVTDPEPLYELLGSEKVTCYIGFDPTADSLHAGHLMAIMGLVHMQRAGHRPIAVIGGGTAMVGDPSGKTEMRKMLTREQIVANGEKIRKQLGHYLDFEQGRALAVDNYEWLGNLNYIEFLRDIGRHFSVNRMLTFETYKMRLETGLSFLEFNYQLLQAYDFLMLYKKYNCRLQMGGDDQWANILAGADLVRRKEGVDVYGLTFPLLVTASGAKMGKTEKGALWLDPEKTSPYEYYQYWINVDDRDVKKFLSFFTLLPIEEIDKVEGMQGAELNVAKTILAYEATKLTHGEEAAKKSLSSSMAAFGRRDIPADILPSSTIPRGKVSIDEAVIPSTQLSLSALEQGINLIQLMAETKIVSSRSEARRLIQQGGVYVNEERVSDIDFTLTSQHLQNDKIALRIGKKKHHHLIFQ